MEKIPPEILEKELFPLLDLDSILNTRLVCRNFRDIMTRAVSDLKSETQKIVDEHFVSLFPNLRNIQSSIRVQIREDGKLPLPSNLSRAVIYKETYEYHIMQECLEQWLSRLRRNISSCRYLFIANSHMGFLIQNGKFTIIGNLRRMGDLLAAIIRALFKYGLKLVDPGLRNIFVFSNRELAELEPGRAKYLGDGLFSPIPSEFLYAKSPPFSNFIVGELNESGSQILLSLREMKSLRSLLPEEEINIIMPLTKLLMIGFGSGDYYWPGDLEDWDIFDLSLLP